MNILVINRKGGVGKTTICDELMFSLERSGINSVYIDLDEQNSSIHIDQSNNADTADVIVIDTPGALSADVRNWMESADIIVIPTNSSGRDIPMMIETLESARNYAPNAKRVVVANNFNRFRAATEFMQVLHEVTTRDEIIATITHGEAFQTAFSEDKSIFDVAPKTKVALTTLETINKIRDAAGLGPDPINPDPIQEYLSRQAILAKERRTK